MLTPLAFDPGHPFPHVHNKSLNIALMVERENGGTPRQHFAVVQVPAVLDRVVVVSRTGSHVRHRVTARTTATNAPISQFAVAQPASPCRNEGAACKSCGSGMTTPPLISAFTSSGCALRYSR